MPIHYMLYETRIRDGCHQANAGLHPQQRQRKALVSPTKTPALSTAVFRRGSLRAYTLNPTIHGNYLRI